MPFVIKSIRTIPAILHLKIFLLLLKKLNKIMAGNTGKTFTEIERDADRDYYMSAEEAKKYGIIDKVL